MRLFYRLFYLAFCVITLTVISSPARAQQDTLKTEATQELRDSLMKLLGPLPDGNGSQATVSPKDLRDSLRMKAPVLRTNLVWDGIAAPNLGMEFPLGKHLSLGVGGGLKPWPRWLAWDWEQENPLKWRHFAVTSDFRWWPDKVFTGFFLGFDMLYSHYNIGNISLPLGMYPILRDHRLQGDFYGIGLSAGGAFWLSDHWSMEMSAGALAGYKKAGKYECAWCGSRVGTAEGFAWMPKLDVSIAYHLFSKKRNSK